MYPPLLLLTFLLGPSWALLITCGGDRHKPVFDSSIFGGCFVTKGDITFEILGKPPKNITGEYGTIILNKTSDCELKLDLMEQRRGTYKCGVIFVTPLNKTRKAVFNHFIIEPADGALRANDQHNPMQNASIANLTLNEIRALRIQSNQTKVTLLIAAALLLILACIILLTMTRSKRESATTFPMTTFAPLESRQDRSYSYPSTSHERDAANRTLSSLELMTAPSPPPFPLSFTTASPFTYSGSEECDQGECSC